MTWYQDEIEVRFRLRLQEGHTSCQPVIKPCQQALGNTPFHFNPHYLPSRQLPPREQIKPPTLPTYNGGHWSAETRYRVSGKKVSMLACPTGRHDRGFWNAKQAVDASTSKTKPSLKRRMSLADELALVGDDSESGYQDEASEAASSASELESDLEFCNSRHMARGRGQSDGYSTNGESAAEESGAGSDDEEDCGDRTLNGLDMAAPTGTPSMSAIHAID